MPSPIPVTRLLPRDFGLKLGALSSPLSKHAGLSSLRVPADASHGRLARRLWSSTVQWRELRGLEPVGSGGFGLVFKGTYFGETVAVKRVRRAKNKLASRQSFWAELNAAHLRHDNLVRVIAATTMTTKTTCALAKGRADDDDDEEEEEGHVGTILMEFAGDVNLQQVVYGGVEPLPPEVCVRYAGDIVRALCHLHAHGVAHLDLKPANVLVSRTGVCKLADFGCSLQLGRDHEARTCAIGGTYTHRAPELLKGEPVTVQADIYSFGVTLWQLFTREPPYGEERQHVIIYAVVAYDLRPELDRDVFRCSAGGRACGELVRHCWSAEPTQRPSAENLLPELDKLSELGFR